MIESQSAGGRDKVNSDTVFYGVFGDPVRHSLSPLMLGRAFAETGVNAVYGAFHVRPEQLGEAVRGIRALGYRGVNVTIPHKVEVMKHLDEIDESAIAVGAVNTIVNRDGILTGYNTDGIGFVRSLKEETGAQLAGARILMLGAGGASRGVAHALAKEGPSTIIVANRTKDKAEALAAHISGPVQAEGIGWERIDHIIGSVDFIVNTTPIGMQPHTDNVPIDPSGVRPGTVVSDLIYNPLKTSLLHRAEAAGAKVHGGLGMFIYQGAYAFEYWTGLSAPVEAMRASVLEAFAAREGAKK